MVLLALGFFLILAQFPTPTRAAVVASPGSATVTIDTSMSPAYDVLGAGSSSVTATVSAILKVQSDSPMEIISSFRPLELRATAIVGGNNVTVPVSVSSGRFATRFSLDFTLSANTTSFFVVVRGVQTGGAFLWRYISDVPSIILVRSPALAFIEPAYTSRVTLPSGTVFSGTFFQNGTEITRPVTTLVRTTNDSQEYLVAEFVGTVVLQSTWYVTGSLVVAALGLIVFVAGSLNSFALGRRVTQIAFGGFATRLRQLRSRSPPEFTSILRGIWSRIMGTFQPKKLLAIFLLCAVLMVGIGATAGPYPAVKAYVMAPPSNVSQIRKSLSSFLGSVVAVSPAQDYSDFEVMSSVADFNIAVISSYPTYALPTVGGFILRGLVNVPVIVLDNSTDPTFASQVRALYGNRLIAVQNAANLTSIEKQHIAEYLSSTGRFHVLGLSLTVDGFKLILAFEGALSFALVFLGWAFLGSLASEAMTRSDFSQFGTVVMAGTFVFLFSETVYITTSIMLAFPISLHAVISGAKDVTAVGYLGFGGGSTPRLVAGFAGILLGTLITKGGPRLEKTDLAIISGLVLFILADPFYVGQFAFQGLLLFIGNFSFGSAFASSLTLKGFIYGVGSVFGGSATPTYLMSAGKMLFFAGLVPFAYLRKMGRSTTALVVILTAVMIGDGGVRVGEMTPDKSVIALVPGLSIGFAFLVLTLGLAAVEKYLRGSSQG